MKFRTRSLSRLALLALFVLRCLPAQVSQGDWPAFRANSQRTNYVEQTISASAWIPLWSQSVLGAPAPAWPAPAKGSLWQKLSKIEARVVDDLGDVPLIASDVLGAHHVLITSSANDRLISLAPETGEIQWQYVTGAPIRYAPSVIDGVAYLGADDGKIRAVELTHGAELWSVAVGPEMPAIIGNNRLISPHPVRTSVLADAECIYASAGLFPSQGVYLVALERDTGQLRWRRKTEKSPQGYLLLTDDNRLYVPTGRAQPFAIRCDNGDFIVDLPSPGGSFCMLTKEAFFAGPGNDAHIEAQPSITDAKMLTFAGRLIVAGEKRIWSANGRQLACLDTLSLQSGNSTPLWSVDCSLNGTMVGTGSSGNTNLFIAEGNKVEVRDGSDGRVLDELTIPNPDDSIKYLAVTAAHGGTSAHGGLPEMLIATTQSGSVYAWRGAERGEHPQIVDAFALPPTREPNRNGTPPSDPNVTSVLEQLPVKRGWILLIGDDAGDVADRIVGQSEFNVLSLVSPEDVASRLQSRFQKQRVYGSRVTVWQQADDRPLSIAPGLFNAVIEVSPSPRSDTELMVMLVDKIGVLSRRNRTDLQIKPALIDGGAWRHQYANATNQADSHDPYVGRASAFRLQWFGGVGPSRMPDRHLRGPAPLAADAVLVMQGDGVLIGVDPANGVERWQCELPPGAMRYVTPLDAGYATLSEGGETLVVAAGKELWKLDGYTGELLDKIETFSKDDPTVWGYVAQWGESIYATRMKPSAARTAADIPTRYTFVNDDYNSERPLVTARTISKLDWSGKEQWSYGGRGVIAHGSIAMEGAQQRMVFVEGCSQACHDHVTDQIPLAMIMQDARLVCLSTETGLVVWEQNISWPEARNMIYGQLVGDKVVLTTSVSEGDKANYAIRVCSLADGSLIWQAQHRHVRSGLFHGEQVHHPVVLGQLDGTQLLVAEPYLYELRSGQRITPSGAPDDWALVRPGHSCGTLTGTGNCLFFRAGNPTVLDLSQPGGNAFTALAPSRAGCWINMIPAAGRLLIPEASASCVCHYSIQTSMAFVPIVASERQAALPVLEEVVNSN